MAKFTQLRLKNLKGQTVAEDLTGLDIFVGPNGSGKSSRPEGLSLAMLGYIPNRGKRAEDTMKVATADIMQAGATLDTGFSFDRTFTKNKAFDRKTGAETFSIKETLEVIPSKGERTEREKKERIADELGDFMIHLDFSEFLALSDAKKREYLSQFVSGDDAWNKEKIEKHLKNTIATETLNANNPEAYDAVVEMITETLKAWVDGLSVEDGVIAMSEWAKAQRSYWNSKKSDAAGAVRQLAEVKNEMDETDRDIAANKEKLDDLHKEKTEAEKEIARGEQIKKNFDERKERIKALEAKLEETEIKPADTTEIEEKIKEQQAKIKDVSFDTSDIDKKIKEKQRLKKDVENKLEVLRKKDNKLLAEYEPLKAAKDKIAQSGGLCVISDKIKCPKDFTPFKEHVEKERKRIADLLRETSDKEKEQKEIIETLEASIKELEKQKSEKFAQAQKQQKINDEIKTKIAAFEKEKSKLENDAEMAKRQYEMEKKELQRLKDEKVEPVPELEILRLQSQGLDKQIEELKTKITKQEESRTTLMNMQSSMLANKDAEFKYNACTSIVEELGPKGVQGEILKSGLEPLRESIQENFDILSIEYPFAFQTETDRGKEVFDFGWVKDESFVPFTSLSTGESMMVLLAVLASLLQQAKAGVRMLVMDDFESLDADRYELTLKGLKNLHDAGKIDNVLIAGVITGKVPEGWNVRDLGAVAEVVAS